ncbi:amino acid transporter aATP11 [Strigomonas culicis]|nr:amino acid transporter aATP11 [Strigomonas culicis]|eukprot:EPY24488.1 amino acid transporter aATP11 [Strigomonas culicis]
MWALCFGGAVGYVIAVGNVIEALFKHDGVPEYLQGSSGRKCIVSGIWLLFMLPLVLPKQVNSLRYASAVGVCFIVFFVICVVIHSAMNGLKNGLPKDLVMVSTGNSGISGLSLFMFAYLCQVNIFRITAEAKRPTVGRLTLQATLACSVCGVMYLLVGLFGYFDFGSSLTGNALSYYDPYASPMFFVCFIGFIIKLCAAFSLNMLACRSAFFSLVNWDVVTLPYWKHTLVSVPFAIGALILGLFVPDINVVFGFVGSLCGGFIGFVFPALFIMYSGNWNWKTAGPVQFVSTYFLLICGVIGIVWGTGSTVYDAVLTYG